jgi:hypothetical protein
MASALLTTSSAFEAARAKDSGLRRYLWACPARLAAAAARNWLTLKRVSSDRGRYGPRFLTWVAVDCRFRVASASVIEVTGDVGVRASKVGRSLRRPHFLLNQGAGGGKSIFKGGKVYVSPKRSKSSQKQVGIRVKKGGDTAPRGGFFGVKKAISTCGFSLSIKGKPLFSEINMGELGSFQNAGFGELFCKVGETLFPYIFYSKAIK